MTYVSAGIIRRRDQILLCQRPPHHKFGLQWEFPGGKREEGEDAATCLVRELKEELDLELDPSTFHEFYTLKRDDTGLVMDFLICDVEECSPRLLEHNGMIWVGREDLVLFSMCINDAMMLDRVNVDELFGR